VPRRKRTNRVTGLSTRLFSQPGYGSLSVLSRDGTAGTLREIETQPTAPPGFVGTNTGSQVVVHPSGKLVFGSNRGDDSIVVFAIDEATGKMTLKGQPKSGGAKPWDFTVDPRWSPR
jgi:6-phosphogluconolactonase